jgi:hypothetical protein
LAKRKEAAEEKEPAAPVAVKQSVKPVKKEKLHPKNKSRLPRRQKKAQQKAAARL